MQVVGNPVLQFAQQRILLLNDRLHIGLIGVGARCQLSQRQQAEYRLAVFIQNYIRPCFHHHGLITPHQSERSDIILARGNRVAQLLAIVCGNGARREDAPLLAEDIGRAAPCQTFEFYIGVNDVFVGRQLGHCNGDGDVVEKLLEAVAFHRNCKVGRAKQLLDTCRTVAGAWRRIGGAH